MPIGACLEAVYLDYLFYKSWPYSTLCSDDLNVMGMLNLTPESMSTQWQQLEEIVYVHCQPLTQTWVKPGCLRRQINHLVQHQFLRNLSLREEHAGGVTRRVDNVIRQVNTQ